MATFAAEFDWMFDQHQVFHPDFDFSEPSFALYLPHDCEVTSIQDGPFFFGPESGVTRSTLSYSPSFNQIDGFDPRDDGHHDVVTRHFPFLIFPPCTGPTFPQAYYETRIMQAQWFTELGTTVDNPTGPLTLTQFRKVHRVLDNLKQGLRNAFDTVVLFTRLNRAILVPSQTVDVTPNTVASRLAEEPSRRANRGSERLPLLL